MERCYVVGNKVLVCHGTCHQWKFNVVLGPKGSRSRMVNGHKVNEVDGEPYAHKLDVLATICKGTIDDRQEERQVPCNCGVVDLIAFLAMEAQDYKLAEVEPAVVVVAGPVGNHPIDHSAEVQLMVEGVKLNSEVNGLGGQSRLVHMEGVSTLVGFHTWVNDRVQIDGEAADIDWYKRARGKRSTQAGGV
jgi:hypothetical protein